MPSVELADLGAGKLARWTGASRANYEQPITASSTVVVVVGFAGYYRLLAHSGLETGIESGGLAGPL